MDWGARVVTLLEACTVHPDALLQEFMVHPGNNNSSSACFPSRGWGNCG